MFIRLMLPILTLGGFGGIWGLLRVGMNTQKSFFAVWSPDKHYRASIIESSGTEGCDSSVLVERRNYLLKTGEFTPFCFAGRPEQVSVVWKDAKSLTIQCRDCGQNYSFSETNWGDLRFTFDLDRPE